MSAEKKTPGVFAELPDLPDQAEPLGLNFLMASALIVPKNSILI